MPPAPERSRDDALAALVLRYVTSHGPATARDLRWWASLTAVDVRTGLALVGDRLDSEVVDDVILGLDARLTVLPPDPSTS